MTRNEVRVLTVTVGLTPLAVFTAVLILAAVFVVWAEDYPGNLPGGIGIWLVGVALVKFWPLIALAWLVEAVFTTAVLAAILRRV